MACATEAADADSTPIRNAEIDAHPLLDEEQRRLLKGLRNLARTNGEPFAMLSFAEVALRAAGVDYAAATADDDIPARAMADAQLRRNAVLYVYEALRATDLDIIRQWDGFDEMLQSLAYLIGSLP